MIDQTLSHHDVALRWGEQEDSALVLTRLGESHQIVCAAPVYLERHGTPSTPEDLAGHNCLMMSRLGLDYNEWTFRYGDGNRSIRTTGNFVVNGGSGHYEALIGGLGIGRVITHPLFDPKSSAGSDRWPSAEIPIQTSIRTPFAKNSVSGK